MLFGLGLSIAVLRLTTYFVINADLAIQVGENATHVEVVSAKFIPVWAGIQILTALCTLLTYCIVGFRANEAVSFPVPLLENGYLRSTVVKGRLTMIRYASVLRCVTIHNKCVTRASA